MGDSLRGGAFKIKEERKEEAGGEGGERGGKNKFISVYVEYGVKPDR